jgi:hypothetical protein
MIFFMLKKERCNSLSVPKRDAVQDPGKVASAGRLEAFLSLSLTDQSIK